MKSFLQLFPCAVVNTDHYLVANTDIECSTSEHVGLRSRFVSYIIVYHKLSFTSFPCVQAIGFMLSVEFWV